MIHRRRFALLVVTCLPGVLCLVPGAADAQPATPVQQSRNWSGYIGTNAYYTGVGRATTGVMKIVARVAARRERHGGGLFHCKTSCGPRGR
jgi:hypothetical protein